MKQLVLAVLIAASTHPLFSQGAAGSLPPTLNCSPGIVCDIELQPGETILGTAIGRDSWESALLASGASPTTPHVLVWPTAPSDPTNILITTDRRTLNVSLTADSRAPLTPKLSFPLPRESARIERQALSTAAEGTYLGAFDPARLNLDYSIPRSPLSPTLVFDDGDKTYIHWRRPPKDAPVVFGIDPTGTTLLTPRVVTPSLYVVDSTYVALRFKVGRQDVTVKTRAAR